MVFKIVWTPKALDSYIANMHYLELAWTAKEVQAFALLVEEKLHLLANQPEIGAPVSKTQVDIRKLVLHKRVILVYRTLPNKAEIHLLLFWNTYQNPLQLKAI